MKRIVVLVLIIALGVGVGIWFFSGQNTVTTADSQSNELTVEPTGNSTDSFTTTEEGDLDAQTDQWERFIHGDTSLSFRHPADMEERSTADGDLQFATAANTFVLEVQVDVLGSESLNRDAAIEEKQAIAASEQAQIHNRLPMLIEYDIDEADSRMLKRATFYSGLDRVQLTMVLAEQVNVRVDPSVEKGSAEYSAAVLALLPDVVRDTQVDAELVAQRQELFTTMLDSVELEED